MNRTDLLQGFTLAEKTVRPLEGRIEGRDSVVRLEPRIMDLLVFLAARRGEVVSRDAIIQEVWRGTLIGDDVISRSVYQIRKAFGEQRVPSQGIIETIPKRGYRLIAAIGPLIARDRQEAPVTPIKSDRDEGPTHFDPPSPVPIAAADPGIGAGPLDAARRPHTGFLLAALSLLLAGAGAMYFATRKPAPNSAVVATLTHKPALQTAPTDTRALVVLPFTNTGGGADATAVGEGLSDDIFSALTALDGIRVIGRVSVARVQADHLSYRSLGAELNAATVMEGSVHTEDDHIVIDVRLINTQTEQVFREKTYRGSFAAGDALRNSVVDDVALALGAPARLASSREASDEPGPEAYRLYLQGWYYAAKNNPGAYRQALDYFSQATQADPGFARAWAAVAMTNMLMIDFGNRARNEATALAEPALKRAQELAPNSPDTLAACGLIALYNHRFPEGADALRRATALRPNYTQAHMWLGRLWMAQGQMHQAAAAFELAYEIDPRSPMVALNLGLALDQESRYEDAARVLEGAIAHEPKLANLYWAYGHVQGERGQLEQASLAYRKAIDLGADYSTLNAQYAILLADLGDRVGAHAALAHAETLNPADPVVWAARVDLAVTDHDQENELRALRRAPVAQRDDTWRSLAIARLELISGRPQPALEIYQEAVIRQHLGKPELAAETELLGGAAAILDAAYAYQATGHSSEAAGLIDLAEKTIAQDRKQGIDSGGYDYLLAAAAAMRADERHCLALLQAATQRGWNRREWLAFDPRFGEPRRRQKLLAELSRAPGEQARTAILP